MPLFISRSQAITSSPTRRITNLEESQEYLERCITSLKSNSSRDNVIVANEVREMKKRVDDLEAHTTGHRIELGDLKEYTSNLERQMLDRDHENLDASDRVDALAAQMQKLSELVEKLSSASSVPSSHSDPPPISVSTDDTSDRTTSRVSRLKARLAEVKAQAASYKARAEAAEISERETKEELIKITTLYENLKATIQAKTEKEQRAKDKRSAAALQSWASRKAEIPAGAASVAELLSQRPAGVHIGGKRFRDGTVSRPESS